MWQCVLSIGEAVRGIVGGTIWEKVREMVWETIWKTDRGMAWAAILEMTLEMGWENGVPASRDWRMCSFIRIRKGHDEQGKE